RPGREIRAAAWPWVWIAWANSWEKLESLDWRGLYRPPGPAARNHPGKAIKHYKSTTYKRAALPLALPHAAVRTSPKELGESIRGGKQSLSRCGIGAEGSYL